MNNYFNLFLVDVVNYELIALIAVIVAVILLVTLIVVIIALSKKIKNLNNNVRQLTNYPVKPLPVEEKKEEAKKEEVKPVVKEEQIEVIKEEVVETKEETPIVEEVKEETPIVEDVKEETPTLKEVIVEEEKKEVKTNSTTRVVLGKYEVFNVNDFYLYRLKASNGEIMVVSEVYTTEKGAISAIDTVKKNVETGTIQIYQEKHGLYQFKLFATNKRLLAVSANYSTQAKCESAANSFKKFAPISPVVVLEEDPEHLMEEIHLEASADKKGGKLAVYEVENGFEFRLLASNGVLLCSSNEYRTKKALLSGITTFKSAIKTGRFFIVKDKNDSYQFKLYNQDKRCIVIGEAYKNKNQAISAAKSVISFTSLAEVVEKNVEEVIEVKGE